MATLAALICVVLAEPIFLDNGKIRIEIEPSLSVIRFIGVPGETNFVDPIYLNEKELTEKSRIDPGGILVDLMPIKGKDPIIIRGPATVIEKREGYVALLGPVSKEHNIRVRKEIQIDRFEARAQYTVTVMMLSSESLKVSLRNKARVPHSMSLRTSQASGKIRALAGTDDIERVVAETKDYWSVQVPPVKHVQGVMLGSFVPEIIQENIDGKRWTRRLVDIPEEKKKFPHRSTFVCTLDTKTQHYASVLQGPEMTITKSSPLVFTEHWAID